MIKPNISVIYGNFLRVIFLPLITDISLCTEFLNYVRNGFIKRAPGVVVQNTRFFTTRVIDHFFLKLPGYPGYPGSNFVRLIEAQLQMMSIALQTEMLETNKHG